MTIQGAIAELQNLLEADDVPLYYKGGIQKVIETIQMEMVAEQTEPSGKRGEMMSQKEFDEMVHRVVLGQTEPSTDCGWK